jgi:2-succinyl-6-hydroxy-2,4-cyclohexadiene-1-carboxylate synthase
MELYHEIHGHAGPYALFVHGFLSSRAQWRLNLPALAGVVRPVIVELWGHGRSPAPADPAAYFPAGYVEAFERLRRALGAERWMLCGQSFGAALTMRYALTHPERIAALVFTNSTAALAGDDWFKARRVSAMKQAEEIERNGMAAIQVLPVHPSHAKQLPPEVHEEMVKDAQRQSPQGIANSLRYTLANASVRAQVKDLRVPTLLVCGKRETRFAPLRAFAEQAIPGLQVVEADAGHAVNVEAAGVFNEAVAAFYKRYAE